MSSDYKGNEAIFSFLQETVTLLLLQTPVGKPRVPIIPIVKSIGRPRVPTVPFLESLGIPRVSFLISLPLLLSNQDNYYIQKISKQRLILQKHVRASIQAHNKWES